MAEAEWLGQNLRAEDAREIETASGLPATTVVPMSFTMARECYTIRLTDSNGKVDERPCAIFGVSDDPAFMDMGIMWLLGTDVIRRGALSIVREAPKWLDRFCALYPAGIHNIVDSRNDLHVRWLMLTGFDILDTPLMVKDVPFIHVIRTLKCVTQSPS